jgi:monoamine oxidase
MGTRRSGLNRRALLAGGGAFAVAGRPAAAADVDVVVIGAGAAGIAAARALRAAGRRAIVLEARGRVGGRAFTDASLGPAYDAGATFIHWAERNPWVQIARDVGVETAGESRGGGFQLFADGRPMAEPERRRRREAFRRVENRLEAADLGPRDLSIAELIGDLGPEFAPVAASSLLLSIGEEAARISARDYRRLWSGDDLVVPTGYGRLVARSAAGLDIRLNEPVETIRWDGPGVAVTSPSGTLRAGACIVTVPVGVLKAGALRFVPQLPEATRDALAGLHMGALTKIALKYDGDRFGIAPGTSLLEAAVPERLLNLVMFPGGKDLVIGFCGGDYARGLCEAGAAEARAHLVDRLATMVGSEIRKAVKEASFPAWWTDPFARGAYSICDPGHETARDALARPVAARLFIAGEATAGGGAMTVGGATLAGRAAAAAALAQMKA